MIKNPSVSLYTLSDYPDLSLLNCPACRTRGHFKPHGCYSRYVIDFWNGRPSVFLVTILREKCECGHTHALLNDFLVPYSSYTLRFMLQVLKAYLRRSRTVQKICSDFQITPPTLYRWKRLFLSHRTLLIGLLRSKESDPAYFLQFIDRVPVLSDFLEAFFRKVSFSFLQSHHNPAYS